MSHQLILSLVLYIVSTLIRRHNESLITFSSRFLFTSNLWYMRVPTPTTSSPCSSSSTSSSSTSKAWRIECPHQKRCTILPDWWQKIVFAQYFSRVRIVLCGLLDFVRTQVITKKDIYHDYATIYLGKFNANIAYHAHASTCVPYAFVNGVWSWVECFMCGLDRIFMYSDFLFYHKHYNNFYLFEIKNCSYIESR